MRFLFYKKWVAIAALICFILWAGLIFSFALQSGGESGDVSTSLFAFLRGIDTSHEKIETDVEKTPIDKIGVSAKQAAYFVGQSTTLSLDISPKNYTEGYVFTSSDQGIATVSDKGVVRFLSAGKVTITVTANSGERSDEVTFSVYGSIRDIGEEDKLRFSISVDDEMPINDCKSVTVNFDGKPISISNSLKPKLRSSDDSVLYVVSPYVVTCGAGTADVTLYLEDYPISTSSVTVTEKVLDNPLIDALFINGEQVDEGAEVFLGRNYELTFALENEQTAVKSYNVSRSSDIVNVTTIDNSSRIVLTPTACGDVTVEIYARTEAALYIYENRKKAEGDPDPAFPEPLKTITLTIIPPPALATGINKPETDYDINTEYSLELVVADKNAMVGYDYTVEGGEFEKSEKGKVTFLKAGEYTVTFTSTYYPENTYVFTILVFDKKTELAIRKQIGHFGMFVVLGVFAAVAFMYFIKKLPYNAIITTFSGLAVAALSEVMQLPLFTEGRRFAFSDVLIDFGGFLAGSILIMLFVFVFYRIRSRRITSSPTEE